MRQIIIPTKNTFVLHLPDQFIGKKVEVIVFSTEEMVPGNSRKIAIENARAFYQTNAVDFSKIEKWKREDLYE